MWASDFESFFELFYQNFTSFNKRRAFNKAGGREKKTRINKLGPTFDLSRGTSMENL